MRRRPLPSTRLASLSLAALGLLLPSRADAAATTYGVTNLGAGVSGLVLGESGQVAGLRPDPNGSIDYWTKNPATAFEYDRGRVTALSLVTRPLSVANNGRVFDSSGPYSFIAGPYPYYYQYGQWLESPATAGNHLGELVGTTTQYPYHNGNLQGSDLYREAFKVPYIYVPKATGSPEDVRASNFNPTRYATGPDIGPNAGRGVTEPGTMYALAWTGPRPTAVNDHSLVIGDIYSIDHRYSSDLFHPIAPSPDPSYIHAASDGKDLGTLGGLNSHAAAVNNFGLVAGSSDTASGASHGFLFMPVDLAHPTEGRMVDIGTLPGMTASAALGLNDKGRVVGWSGSAAIKDAILVSDGIMEDLNDRLPATLGLHLDQATAINDAGQIVAYGHGADGVEHGYLLSATPTPEPTALALLALAGVGLGVRRLGFSK